jgi:iron complex outermembrane recepter protein
MGRRDVYLSVMAAAVVLPLALQAADVYKLDAVETTTAKEVVVESNGISDGFLDKNVTVGPLGQKKAIDTPYQINTIPKEVIENEQAQGLQDVVKYIPSAQIEARGGAEVGRPQTRGMRGDVVANSFWDGLHTVSTTAIPMEMFENLQIINGLAGSLYGPASPAGIYDFILKRPTSTYYNSITMSYMNDGNVGVHGDFSGREGMVGYRVNLLKQDGEGYVTNSDLERQLISTALDFYLTDRLTLETNFSRYTYKKEGYAGIFTMPNLSGGIAKYQLPSAVSSDTVGLGQEYAGMDLETTTASAKVKYDISNDWYFEGGYLFQRADRSLYTLSNTFTNNVGDYQSKQSLSTAAGRFEIQSWMGQLNTNVETFGLEHALSLGGNGYEWSIFSNRIASTSTILGTSNIYNPLVFGEPSNFSDALDRYKSGLYDVKSITLGDTLKLTKEWSMMLSMSESSIKEYGYSTTGVKTENYSENGESYAASLIYKPLDNLSLYATYADSLQEGSVGTNSDGSTVVLAPSRSKQYEVGAKTSFYNVDFSTALFEITRPIAYQGSDGIFKEQGEQRNRGIELMASGTVVENLSVFGGITLLDPVLKDAKTAALEGNTVIGMPKVQYNLLFDYALPISSGVLGFNTNFHYTDERAIDEANTQYVDSYFTIDIGARYSTKKLLGDKTTFRLTVNNLTNEKYWDGIFASSGLDGLGSTGGTNLVLGEPRRFIASIQVNF